MKVVVYNSAGEAVLVLFDGSAQSLPAQIKYSASSFVAGSESISVDYGTLLSSGYAPLVWTGISQSGQAVEGGVYVIKTEMVDSFGKMNTFGQQVQVIAAPPSAVINIFNSAGELVYHESLSITGGSVTSFALDNEVLVLGGDATPGLKLSGTLHSNLGNQAWSWDGKNTQGQEVAPGVYEISLSGGQGSGDGGVLMSKSVQVLASESSGLSALKPYVAPNPLTDALLKAGQPLSVRFIAAAGALQGRLYNLAGEMVSTATAPGNSGQMRFYPGPLASGVYIIVLDYQSGSGARSRMNLKLVILR